jgi:L-aspartate oxidase
VSRKNSKVLRGAGRSRTRRSKFVQFHPTALDLPSHPMALISEAVRGEGAILVDEGDHRFMAGHPGAELAPRDIVARAVCGHRADGHRTFLDARRALGSGFATRSSARL